MPSPAIPPQTIPSNMTMSGALIESRSAQTLSSNGAVSFDASTSNLFVVSLQANATSSTITNATAGQVIVVKFIQDATGGRTYAWPANYKFGTGVTTGTTVASGAPTDTTASKGRRIGPELVVTLRKHSVSLWRLGSNLALRRLRHWCPTVHIHASRCYRQ
jgi:hypothetical protein